MGDLAGEPLEGGSIEPPDLRGQLLAAGYRSFLIVSISTRFQPLHLTFWSKHPNAFSLQDVTVARPIARCVGLAFSHQQLAEATRRVTETHQRADHLAMRA